MSSWEILPLKGLPEIAFGSSEEEVVALLGQPSRRFPVEESGYCLDYEPEGIGFFFSDEMPALLESIEISAGCRAQLWGHSLFDCNQAEIQTLIKNHSRSKVEEEYSDGDLSLFVEDEWIFFFFEQGELTEVLWSSRAS